MKIQSWIQRREADTVTAGDNEDDDAREGRKYASEANIRMLWGRNKFNNGEFAGLELQVK